MATVTLDTRLDRVLGGKALAALQRSLEIETVGDLLAHYPRRLHDSGELSDFSDLPVGEHATVIAKVLKVDNLAYTPKGQQRNRNRPAYRTEVAITDGSRQLQATFFRQAWRKGALVPGTIAMFSGKVTLFKGRRQLQHPTCDILGHGSGLDEFAGREIPRWIPIYPATAAITSQQIAQCIAQVLRVLDATAEPVPDEVRSALGLMGHDEALRGIHQPQDDTQWHGARSRLRFDEAFVVQTVLAQRRQVAERLPALARPILDTGLRARFEQLLPFALTAGQRQVGAEISADLARPHPMHRLLQGEVGSGKTVVALRAMLQVIDAGGQAALLAPTEVLALQHYRSITELLGPLAAGGMLDGAADGTRVALLTGSQSTARRRQAMLDAASGVGGIVVGTHALLEETVSFADLGLVVIDEQHRFGVEQRAALTVKAGHTPPHVLVMTATPIPRTVAMTVFGDLETSTLRELPQGRIPIQSTVVPVADRPGWLDRAWERVREESAKGHQTYIVCPRIGADPSSSADDSGDVPGYEGLSLAADAADGPSDDTDSHPGRAVLDMAAELADGPLAGLRIGVLHGRLAPDEKDKVMRSFTAGAIDVLIATTVIEVGVDVANASLMVVLDAERFGVSQLHQLRGRVGRGSAPGLCLLVTESSGTATRERLDGVAATSDGFELARLDLAYRREGDVLGASQSGRKSSLKLLSVLRDEDVISAAREAADAIVGGDPDLERQPVLAAAVARLVETDQAGYLDKS